MFFPLPPDNLNDNNHLQEDYPNPLPDPPTITKEQISTHIANLSPHKAPGPDGIPNIVLKESSEIITVPLTNIYKALIRFNIYYDPWREFTTVML